MISPPENYAELVKAAKAFYDDLVESGAIEVAYQLPTGGGVLIVNVDSGDELFQVLHSYPLYGQFDWSAEALADMEATFDWLMGHL